jgi:threonine synthase
MIYIFDNIESTFDKAIFNNLLHKDGLWMPETIPKIHPNFINNCDKYSYLEISKFILNKFIPEDIIKETDLNKIIEKSYNFEPKLVNFTDNISIFELFHGPTLAFKDFGVNFMANLYDYFVSDDMNINIINATSGDTGSAVANSFYNKNNIKVFILYPKNKISILQEQQICSLGKNIFPIEIDGSFDDCQKIVKQILNETINSKIKFISANSINIARLLPQITYYFYLYGRLKTINKIDKKIIVSVPSGNLGNLTAGLFAKKMGLPIHKFICALNLNNTFYNYLNTGNYISQKSVKTLSNAMDIGNPSNFIRIPQLYSYTELTDIVKSYFIDDNTTILNIENIYRKYNYILDPHSSVGYCALQNYIEEINNNNNHYVLLSTAHPIKFEKEINDNLSEKIDIIKPKNIDILFSKETMKKTLSNEYNLVYDYILDTIKLKQNIILIGMPYSGKTTYGKELAKNTNREFIDTDELIERKYNKSLIDILNICGNEVFLEIEKDIVKSIQGDNLVISTGGSVIYKEESMNYLNSMYGKIIYLNITYETLENRCNNLNTRGVVLKPLQSLNDLYNERIPYYEKYSNDTILND